MSSLVRSAHLLSAAPLKPRALCLHQAAEPRRSPCRREATDDRTRPTRRGSTLSRSRAPSFGEGRICASMSGSRVWTTSVAAALTPTLRPRRLSCSFEPSSGFRSSRRNESDVATACGVAVTWLAGALSDTVAVHDARSTFSADRATAHSFEVRRCGFAARRCRLAASLDSKRLSAPRLGCLTTVEVARRGRTSLPDRRQLRCRCSRCTDRFRPALHVLR